MKIDIIKAEQETIFRYFYSGSEFCHILRHYGINKISDDAAIRIAMLSRPKNSNEYLFNDLKLSQGTIRFLNKSFDFKVKIKSLMVEREEYKKISHLQNKNILMFSGGFDSIAAKALVGNKFELLSIKFGGAFKRESDFFSKFSTSTFDWNIRNYNFNENLDWRFLISPVIAYLQNSDQITAATGTILETTFFFRGLERPNFTQYSQDTFGSNIGLVNPIGCLSEYLTAKITNESIGETLTNESLASLASPTTLKYYRKKALLDIARGKSGSTIPSNVQEYKFSSDMTEDIICLYLCWKLGVSWVNENYCSIPKNFKIPNMSYFERYHNYNLQLVDENLRKNIEEHLSSFNISKMSSQNYQEIEFTREVLTGLK